MRNTYSKVITIISNPGSPLPELTINNIQEESIPDVDIDAILVKKKAHAPPKAHVDVDALPDDLMQYSSIFIASDESQNKDLLKKVLKHKKCETDVKKLALLALIILLLCIRLYEKDELEIRFKDHLDEWFSKHSTLLFQSGIPSPQVNELQTEINKLIRII